MSFTKENAVTFYKDAHALLGAMANDATEDFPKKTTLLLESLGALYPEEKLTYMKSIADPFYRLQSDYTSHHNHGLPVLEFLGEGKDRSSEPMNEEEKKQYHIKKEQENILSKLMKNTGEEGKKAGKPSPTKTP